ncbi:Uma2 family endonuclease [Scytonema hofmannii FACHB-248]|uniref:Uma2 family endonuclease n=1 Tax=Scytonema hofmannii FACHB-248 TaxID=1842502 RepID=A0ABR8GKN2_9CYAN|nr:MULTISPECIES: Uma2 family endonuclease [Nostocales]MBD2603734.1 Uma2 family endonuclease [Scytonema hofmannii FACHB-248]
MSVPKDFETPKDVIFPTGDLHSDEPPLESDLHRLQMTLLIQSIEWLWQNRNDFYASGNLTVYYSSRQPKSEDFRGPDFFVALGTYPAARKSWVVWEEDGKYPNVIVELLSDSTAATDKGLKKQIYQNTFRTPDYFWFDPNNLEFAGFILVGGEYQPLQPNPLNWLWSQQLGLYLGVYEEKLRFFTSEGQLVTTSEEEAQHERQQKELAEETSDRLPAKLPELNIEPDLI